MTFRAETSLEPCIESDGTLAGTYVRDKGSGLFLHCERIEWSIRQMALTYDYPRGHFGQVDTLYTSYNLQLRAEINALLSSAQVILIMKRQEPQRPELVVPFFPNHRIVIEPNEYQDQDGGYIPKRDLGHLALTYHNRQFALLDAEDRRCANVLNVNWLADINAADHLIRCEITYTELPDKFASSFDAAHWWLIESPH